MGGMSLLTAKEVVGELERLGVGLWSADVVIKWTLEEPACPIALRAEKGKPHRYRMIEVLPWLLARTQREVTKGVAPGAADKLRRIEAAMRMFATGKGPTAQPIEIVQTPDPRLDDAVLPLPVPPAKAEADLSGIDFQSRNLVELLLEIIHGRDPRTAKVAEEALRLRQERLEAEGRLVPVEDVQRMTDAMAILVRLAAEKLPERIATLIQDTSSRTQRLQVVQDLIDELLQRLEKAAIADEAPAEEQAEALDA